MTSQVFYRKWRPQRFVDVVGQEYVTHTLLNALATGQVAHAYLLCGPRGTGKTSTGRIMAKALNCQRNGKGEPCNQCNMCNAIMEARALDLIEIDAASNRGIDEMRSLREKVNFAPNEARYKVYIIDEVHMLTNEAFNALLKTLEEPPPHTVFILATTEAQKLPATVISRCQRFDFRRISFKDVADRLTRLCQDEAIEAAPEVLMAVARSAGGSLRDAENIFEQLVVGYGRKLEISQLRDFLGLGGERQVKELAAAILAADIANGLRVIGDASAEGLDLRQFHRQVMEYLRALLLIKAGVTEAADGLPDGRQALEAVVSQSSLDQIVRAVKSFGQVDLRTNTYSTLSLELALVDAVAVAPAPAAAPLPRPSPSAPRVPPPTPPQPAPRVPEAPSRGPNPPRAPSPPPQGPPAAETGPRPRTEAVPTGIAASMAEAPAKAPPAQAAPAQAAPAKMGSAIVKEAATGVVPAARAAKTEAPSIAAAGAASPPSPGVDLVAKLRDDWKTVIETSKYPGQKVKIDVLLRSGEPVSVDASGVVLAFPYEKFVDMMRQELENPGSRRALEDALAKVLGQRVQVRCVVRPKQKSGGHLLKAAVEMGARVVEEDPAP